jgi:hypothetical protein
VSSSEVYCDIIMKLFECVVYSIINVSISILCKQCVYCQLYCVILISMPFAKNKICYVIDPIFAGLTKKTFVGILHSVSVECDIQRGSIYTEKKLLGHLCKLCNPFFYEF